MNEKPQRRPGELLPIAAFCGKCDCGCPRLHVDPDAMPERRIVLTDDFGQLVQMSSEQWRDLVRQAKSGMLDEPAAAVASIAGPGSSSWSSTTPPPRTVR